MITKLFFINIICFFTFIVFDILFRDILTKLIGTTIPDLWANLTILSMPAYSIYLIAVW